MGTKVVIGICIAPFELSPNELLRLKNYEKRKDEKKIVKK